MPPALGVGAVGIFLFAGALFWAWRELPSRSAAGLAKPVQAGKRHGLGALAGLRAALAAGADRAEIERRLAEAPAEPRCREVQALWRAQSLLSEGDLNGADAVLHGLPAEAEVPLAGVLRARLAFRRMQREDTGYLYEEAIRRSVDNDGLRLEAAFAKALTDESERAEADFAQMVEMGSRLSEPWYVAAEVAASQDRLEEAEAYLRRAWQLEPAPRASLFDNAVLAFLVARPTLFPLFQLGVPEEPRLAPEGARVPISLPAELQAATCGQTLRLTLGSAELVIPGGAPLAPPTALVEDAGTWSRHAEAKALAALPSLIAASKAGGSLPPRLLRLSERAGSALAAQNRWNDVVGLTQAIGTAAAAAPASLVRLRAQALHHVERDGEARQLLVQLAKSDLASRRPAAGTLFDLAELFAASGDYDTAIKLSQKADSQLPEPRGAARRRQLELDRELATSYASFLSQHFEVRYPQATGEKYARQLSWVLEEERKRLAQWIPETGGRRIEVHLFPVQKFLTSFSGDIAVVGIFDGKVRVPFAELRSLHPQLVAILSHELAHALIAAATHDQAPHWFQEGLAQHIEMGTERVNALPDLARSGRALSFPTLDLILRGFAEEQLVGLAYSESAWAVAYLEAQCGDRAIPRMVRAYAAGKTTDQALHDVCGFDAAGLDRGLWAWAASAPKVRALQARRYDLEDASTAEQARDVDLPHAGWRRDAADSAAAQAEDRRRRLAAWHAVYAERTAAVKRALKPVLQAYQDEGGAARGVPSRACADLANEVHQTLADPAPWSSPDAGANRALRDAYRLIGEVGDACRSGRDSQVRTLIDKLNAALDRAAQLLSPYGLTP